MANAQPSNLDPYLQPENPVTRNPLEEKATEEHVGRHEQGKTTTTSQHNNAQSSGVPTSLGRGVQGAGGPVDAQEARATARGEQEEQQTPQNDNVNADAALATLAEGDVAHAYQRKSGTQRAPGSGPAEEQDFASDLDRKKAEQAAARDETKEARQAGQNVDGGGVGGRLGDETLDDA